MWLKPKPRCAVWKRKSRPCNYAGAIGARGGDVDRPGGGRLRDRSERRLLASKYRRPRMPFRASCSAPPDVAAAERRMAAANAEIGVAQAAFYPRVQLTGTAGLQSIDLGTLFNWPSRFWAIGPSVQLPLFTGGRNRAQLENARAVYDETVAQYRQRVLTAFQDVEDQLAAGQLLRTELQAEEAALTAAATNARDCDQSLSRRIGNVS